MSLAAILRQHPLAQTSAYRIAEHLDYQYDPKKYPYYGFCPKDRKENAVFRQQLYEAAREDYVVAGDLWEACAQDVLFFLNATMFTYDPRLIEQGQDSVVPFITWPFQDWAMDEIRNAFGKYDLNSHKSRDLGWSWMVLASIDHSWRFDSRTMNYLLVSAKEDLVDWKANPATLFAKLDFIDKYLPPFLMPREGVTRFNLHRENNDNGSVINGSSSTGGVGRAGRYTVVYMDEFSEFPKGEDENALASTQKSTKCRIWTATPKGEGTAQAGLRKTKGIRTIATHWSEHPVLVRGLYRWAADQNAPEIIDADYPFPDGYAFVQDGKWRSVYRDAEDDRISVPWLTDQELDISYQAESRPFFDGPTLDRLSVDCRTPTFEGDLDFDPENNVPRGVRPHKGGPLRLWIKPDRPQYAYPYVVGADVSAGTSGSQASNSVLSVWDVKKGHQVGEYVCGNKTPEDFARIAIAMSRWFGGPLGEGDGALLIWENQGPGGSFGVKIVQYEYNNIYFRRSNEQDVKRNPTTIPGFTASRTNKLIIFSELRRALSSGDAKTWSRDAIEEARAYRYIDSTQSGVEFAGMGSGMNKAECGANHGDRVSAQCLAWKLVLEHELYPKRAGKNPEKPETDPMAPCLADRQKQRRSEEMAMSEDWY